MRTSLRPSAFRSPRRRLEHHPRPDADLPRHQLRCRVRSPAWNTNWSSATDQMMKSRISTTERRYVRQRQPTGLPQARRGLHHDERSRNADLSQATFQVVVDKATLVIGTPSMISRRSAAASVRCSSGSPAQQTLKASTILNQQVGMEKVDPTEASVRVTSCRTRSRRRSRSPRGSRRSASSTISDRDPHDSASRALK